MTGPTSSEGIAERLRRSRALGLYPYDRAYERAGPAHVLLGGRRFLMASSYDYLSLAEDERIQQAASDAIRLRGTGTGGVRLLTGSLPEHRALEERIARWYGTEDCVVLSAGYFANIAALSAFPGSAVFLDEFGHRSLVDACLLARCRTRRWRHNDLSDLGRLLDRNRAEGRLIVTESLFSMDGDVAPLQRVADLAGAAGCTLIVDDAHGLGILDRIRLPGTVWTGALSKAVPSNGGFVAADAQTIDRVRHMAGPYIFSAALTPASTAAAHAAIDIIHSEPERRERLRSNIACFRAALDSPGADPASPIRPVHFETEEAALRASAALLEAGIVATPIVAPAVGARSPRLRICINAAHSTGDLGRLAEEIKASLSDVSGTIFEKAAQAETLCAR